MPSWLGRPATASTWHQIDSGHARAEHLHRALQWAARRPPERDDVHVARSDEDCPQGMAARLQHRATSHALGSLATSSPVDEMRALHARERLFHDAGTGLGDDGSPIG